MITSDAIGKPPMTPYAFSKQKICPRVAKLIKRHGHTILGADYKLKNIRPQLRQGLIKILSQAIFDKNLLQENQILYKNLNQNMTIIQILNQIKSKIISKKT